MILDQITKLFVIAINQILEVKMFNTLQFIGALVLIRPWFWQGSGIGSRTLSDTGSGTGQLVMDEELSELLPVMEADGGERPVDLHQVRITTWAI